MPLWDKILYLAKEDADYDAGYVSTNWLFVIPHSIDRDCFSYKEKTYKLPLNCLFVGDYSYKPNLNAVNFIKNELLPEFYDEKEIKLLFAGSKMLDLLKSELLKYKNVEILPFFNDVNQIYDKADILLAPIFYGSGVKTKVMEAMATGVLVLGTKEAVSGLDVKDGIHYIEASREEFTICLRNILQGKYRIDVICEQARGYIIKNHSLQNVAVNQWLKLLKL